MDIRRYFDSVDHARLKLRFRRLFKDAELLLLLDRIVESYEDACLRGKMDVAELQRRVGALLAHTDQAQCLSWRRLVVAGCRDVGELLPP